jgi:solute:Na+ symporter, SSS family
MVPAAILILAAATLFAKNFFRLLFRPAMTDDEVAKLAKVMVVVVTAIALYFAMHSSTTLVQLLLLAYAGIAQFLPGVALGLYWKRVTMAGVFAGIVTGVGITALLLLSKHDPFFGLNAGFVALCLNFAVTVSVSLITRPEMSGFEAEEEQLVQSLGHQ